MSDSVRTQRTFDEHMRTLLQNIDNAIYAGEVACNKTHNEKLVCLDTICPFRYWDDFRHSHCKVVLLRNVVGEHFESVDIEIPKDDTPFKRKDAK